MNTSHKNGGASCVAVLLSLVAIFTTASCSSPPVVDTSGRMHGTVTHVVDGDTLKVKLGSRSETIRLIGVDTPETKHPTKPIECWGPEASTHTQSLLPPGTDVVVVRDEEARDKYGRLLAYVTRTSDNLFINLDLISGGWANTLSIEPNTAYAQAFDDAASTAQRLQLGLWAHCRR
jgi:micrococcal nuclease